MLGGGQPFQTASLATTIARIVHVDPPALKNVPGQLAAVIFRALAKNPDARYPTAAAFLDDLRRIQESGKPKRVASSPGVFHQYRMLAALAIVVIVVALLLAYSPARRWLRSSIANNAASPSQSSGLPQTKILAVLPFTAAAKADPKVTALGEGLVEIVAAKLGKLTEDRALSLIHI